MASTVKMAMAPHGSTELAFSAGQLSHNLSSRKNQGNKNAICDIRSCMRMGCCTVQQCKLLPDKTDIEGGQASVQGNRAGVNAHQGHPPRISNHIKRQDWQIILCARVHHTMDYLCGTERCDDHVQVQIAMRPPACRLCACCLSSCMQLQQMTHAVSTANRTGSVRHTPCCRFLPQIQDESAPCDMQLVPCTMEAGVLSGRLSLQQHAKHRTAVILLNSKHVDMQSNQVECVECKWNAIK